MTPTGLYSGTVFQDFNSNGSQDLTTSIPNAGVGSVPVAVDRGMQGITVSAFNNAGGAEGTTTTLANGTFAFTPTGTGPYRFEFSNLPAGFFPGPDGADSHSTVQFAADGGAVNLSLGIVRPADYSENNPLLVTNQFTFGDSATQTPNETTLLSFPYSAGGGTASPAYEQPGAPHEIQIPAARIGATWGLGWDQFGRDLYAAAYFKRHSGFGPDGTGAIYQIPVPATLPPAPYAPPPGSLLYADLNAIFGVDTAGPNQHDTVDDNGNGLQDDYDRDNGNAGWDAVGKTALGGLDVSDDGQFVFVMNLFDRQLYRIPTSGTIDSTTIQRVSIPLTNPDTAIIAPGTFDSNDLRPFAVEYHNGQVYVGVVYSAEATDNRDELLAMVYTVDPATMTFSADPVFQARLNYIRSQSSIGFAEPGVPSTWEPWESAYFSTASDDSRGVAPQPMLTGLTFDPQGNLVLGIRDRGSDQTGYFQLSNPANGTRVEGFTSGDILRAFINTPNDLSSGWTLESNSRGPSGEGIGPQNNNRGPGGGEFYFEDSYGTSHGETSMGGVMQLPGFPQVALTNMDPGDDFRAGGISWFTNQTGAENKAYEIYQNINNPLPFEATFSKANGLGDLIALTSQAPLEIGDRIWLDRNGNGIQDAGEEGIAGIDIQLLDAGGAPLATATTDANGNYYFSSAMGISTGSKIFNISLLQPGLNYTLSIPNAAGGAQQTGLVGRALTIANAPSGIDSDIRDSDGSLVGNDAVFAFMTGAPGSNDHTFDFGFQFTFGVGNRVWSDVDNSGTINGAETGIDGVTVNIYLDANNDGTPDGGAINSTTTAGGGYYRFDRLPAGTYIVEVDTNSAPLAGLTSSTVDGGDPDTVPADSDDNGVVLGVGFVRSNPITLGPDDLEPSTEADLGPGDPTEPDGTTNLTVDFGFTALYSLGNRVWSDADNSGTINGVEAGIDGVTVNLYRDTNNDGTPDGASIATAVTASGGYYRFDDLVADNYIVEVDTTSSPLTGLVSSTVDAGDPDTVPTDSDDNGVVLGAGFVRSNPVTLGPGASEPTTETDLAPTDPAEPNGLSNMTVDFGFFGAASLGNFVWEDLNGNGIQDGGEPGIDNVTVNLLGAGSDNMFGTADDVIASTMTAGGGLYQFPNLAPGTYRVTFVAPGGFTFTARDQGGDDTTDSDADPTTGITVDTVLTLGEQDPTWDAGLFRPVSIGNFVWEDLNANGVQDGGEPGIDNVTVNLLGAGLDNTFNTADDITSSTTTMGGGMYLFPGLTPGMFQVTFVPPSGFIVTAPDQGGNDAIDSDANPIDGSTIPFAVPSGMDDLTWDAGVYEPASVGDRVWYDADGDGVQDPGEPGINGATVILDYAGPDGMFGTADDQLGQATQPTAGDGDYLFDNLAPGNYRIRVVSATLPNGLNTQTFDLDGLGTSNQADFSLASNQNRTDVDFGYRGTASLGDRVWFDTNGDGVQDPGETGLNGVNMQLTWAGVDGTFGTPDDFTITQPTTGDGDYLFDNLPSGNFRVDVLGGVPPTYGPTFDLDGIATPNTATTTLSIAENRTDVDFGYADRSSISGYVYLDLNNDGIRDPGENAISQVLITLTGTDVNGTPVTMTTTTDSAGFYSFPNLLAGTYTITESQPGVVLDGKDTAGTPALGGTTGNDTFTSLVLPSGTNAVDYNFGELPATTSLGGTVYFDKNNNGTQDPGEPGIGGVVVYLRGTNDLGMNVRKSVITDSQGNYVFLQLRPGTYRLTEAQLPAYVDGKDQLGSLGGTQKNDRFRDIVMAPGDQGVAYNFGERAKKVATVVLSKRLYISTPVATSAPIVSAPPGSGKRKVETLGIGAGQIEP